MTDPLGFVDHLEALLEDAEGNDVGVATGARRALPRARRAVEVVLAQQTLSEPDEIIRAARQVRRSLLVGLKGGTITALGRLPGAAGAQDLDPGSGIRTSGESAQRLAGERQRWLPADDRRPSDAVVPEAPPAVDPCQGRTETVGLSPQRPSMVILEISRTVDALEAVGRQRSLRDAERETLDACRRDLHGHLRDAEVRRSDALTIAALVQRVLVLALHAVGGTALLAPGADVQSQNLVSGPARADQEEPTGAPPADREGASTTATHPVPTTANGADIPVAGGDPPAPVPALGLPPVPSTLAQPSLRVRPVPSFGGNAAYVPLFPQPPETIGPVTVPPPVKLADATDAGLVALTAPRVVEEGEAAGQDSDASEPKRAVVPGMALDEEPIPALGRPTWTVAVSSAGRVVGVALILFILYALFGTAVVEGRAQRSMDPVTHARLTSADIGLDSLVPGTDSRRSLARGPGFVPGSAIPGSDQPVVIVGHRTTYGGPFRNLSALHRGAQVRIRTPGGQTFTYAVERSLVTTPNGSIAESGGTQTLLLVSATPAYHDSRRLVVVARLVGGGNRAVAAQTIRLPALGGSPVNLVAAAFVLGLLAVLGGARGVLRHTFARWLAWVSWLPAIPLFYVSWQLLLGSMSRTL